MKIATWNVNGIRARHAQVQEWIAQQRPDVVCLQEIKAAPDDIPLLLCDLDGYWCYWHGGKGYSGVALHVDKRIASDKPAFTHPAFDHEHRIVTVEVATDVGTVTVASIYVPNGGKDFPAKMRFLQALDEYASSFQAANRQLVLCGDLNVARTDRDVHPKERKPRAIGQLPEERALLECIIGRGLVDVGRALDPDNDGLFTWWAPWRNLRQRNIGWRLDYVLASTTLAARATACTVERDMEPATTRRSSRSSNHITYNDQPAIYSMSSVLDRFLRYVRYDTQSDERSTTCPSTDKQLVLLRDLVAELKGFGLADANIDAHGYVMATIPATTLKRNVPTIGFIAHVDTSPEMSGADVKPVVHGRYDGRDIVLPDDPTMVLRLSENADLAQQMGNDIVTASGTTLLGADNKAGVAEIVTAAAYLVAHDEIPHGTVRIAFTPDEEIGRGPRQFDLNRFGAYCAYTMDGGSRGEVETESFSADAMTVAFHGFNTHPGYAKGRMVNAIKVAADFIQRLPTGELSPETTDGHQGFVHPYVLQAGVDRTSVKLLIRDFETRVLADKEAMIEQLARESIARFPGARLELTVEQSYRNMKEILDRHPEVALHACEAVRRAGIEVKSRPIRGGTDGSQLSFMGLPTPNIFAGEHNFHSRLEWVSVQDMEKAVEVIVNLCCIWEENAR